MANYLTVLDKNETKLGYLIKAKFVEIRDRLNGETLLSFEIPFDVEETKHITLEGFVIDDVGQKYVIRSIEKSENNKRNLIVGCVHVFSELGYEYIDRTVELFGVDCQTAATEALQGTEFTIGSVNVSGLHDIDISEIYVLKALQDIREKWDCDLWFDNRTVYLGTKGVDNNEEIRHGKNLKTIKEPTDSNKVITRLIVYGKDGLTIETVNNNVKYLDSPYINDYRRPKCGKVVFSDITDQNELKYEGEKYLSKNDTPNVSYQISFVELEKLGKEPKKISVGDTIAITHTKFGMDKLKTRVQEYIRYPFEPKLGAITLSSIVETSVDDIVNLKKGQKKTDEYINKRFKETSETLITLEKKKVISTTAPTDTSVMWFDSNYFPYVAKIYDGTTWVKATPTLASEVGAYTTTETDDLVSGMDIQLRDDLSLVSPLPTSLTLDQYGITATADTGGYARLDYRGLYVFGGAIQIDGGLSQSQLDTTLSSKVDSGASAKSTIDNKAGLTYIDSTGVYTGTLSANQVNAGVLDAQFVSTNIQQVNEKLHIGGLYTTTGEKGVYFSNAARLFTTGSSLYVSGGYVVLDGAAYYGSPNYSTNEIATKGDLNNVVAKFG